MNQIEKLAIQLRLIQVTFLELPTEDRFTLTIANKNSQYNTSPFQVVENKIDLKSCSPISFYMQEGKLPLLKIAFKGCENNCTYQTQIEYKIIEVILLRGKASNRSKQRHVLGFPLFGSGHTVVGELKIKLSVLQSHSQSNLNGQTTKMAEKNHRHLVLSQSDESYFQPSYSRMIKVSLDQTREESEEHKDKKRPVAVEHGKIHTKHELFEPFKEEISEIELRNSIQGRENEQEQCQMAELANSDSANGFLLKYDTEEREREGIADIPEDCRYLFQKINEINRRYAPLERIPSQQEFSENSELSHGDYKLETDISSDQVSYPLQEVQELLKQLDLIKFAQTLQAEQSPSPSP